MTTKIQSNEVKEHQAELFDDRAIDEHGQDRLGHRHVADELARLVRTVRTPANIALYGRWGAGKSSLANLLARRADEAKEFHFVRFDAFKWAEMPLRRHFISQVAASLGVKNRDYSEGLYQHEETVRIRLPSRAAVLGTLAVVVAVGFMLIVTTFIVANTSDRDAFDILDQVVKVLGMTTIAASITSLLAFFAGKTLPIKRTSLAPSSDEQFERLFQQLVRAIPAPERIVLFVDELDRCSPSEVVTTLESIKTFLGVPRCVFIVAADRAVLEYVLSYRMRHATPIDRENPYYSSGSEYLDKVFHYQVEVPPLMPQRLSAYALDLVRERGGLWQDIEHDEVIPILIPTHIRSPRRVKALLNSFAITFRIACVRSDERIIDSDIRARAREIAKLVALRMEFPLFAKHLELDDRLCEWIPKVRDGDISLPAGMSPKIRDLVQSYARAEMPVDQQVVTTPGELRDGGADPASQDPSSDPIGETEKGNQVDYGQGPQEIPVDRDRDQLRAAHKTHGLQLVGYLQKTRMVDGPKRDLIFLETSGLPFDLDPGLADRLETAAVDGNLRSLRRILEELPESDQVAAIRLLAVKSRHASGVEADNATRSILTISSDASDEILQAVADHVLDVVEPSFSAAELTGKEIEGAFRLCLAGGRKRPKMLNGALNHPSMLEDHSLGKLVLISQSELLKLDGSNSAKIVGYWLANAEHADLMWSTYAERSADERGAILSAAGDYFKDRLKVIEQSDDDEANVQVATAIEVLHKAMLTQELEQLLALVLDVGAENLEREILKHKTSFSAIRGEALARAVAKVAARRSLKEWAAWLTPLVTGDTAKFVTQELGDGLVAHLIGSLNAGWREAGGEDALEVFKRLQAHGAVSDNDFASEELGRALGELAWSELSISEEEEVLTNAVKLCDGGKVARQEAIGAIVGARLRHHLGLPGSSIITSVLKFVNRWVRWLGMHGSVDEVVALMKVMESSTILTSPRREVVISMVTRVARSAGKSIAYPYDTEEIIAVVKASLPSNRDLVVELIGNWLVAASPPVEDARSQIDRFVRSLPEGLEEFLQEYARRLTGTQKRQLLWPTLMKRRGDVDRKYLEAVDFGSMDDEHVAALCVELYSSTSNNRDRARVLNLLVAGRVEDYGPRKRVFESILMPAIQENKGSLEAVLRHLELLRDPPYGTKIMLRDILESTLRDYPKLYRKYHTELEELGLIEKRSLLGRLLG